MYPIISEDIRAYHLDCGRKYFTLTEIENLIDELKVYKYNYLELALGNDGMRFLLDDMSLTTDQGEYSSETVKNGIHTGNIEYYDAGNNNELNEEEMNELVKYANKNGVKIIPLINTPGHMDSILKAANKAIGEDCSYKGSARTIDITNEKAVSFTKELLKKYITYFAQKGYKYFNLGCDEYANDIFTTGGMGFGNLVQSGKYVYFLKYLNEIVQLVKDAGMSAIVFNDGIYYSNIKSQTLEGKVYTPDKDIIVSYWSNGWSGYNLAQASVLIADKFKILNTNSNWYYILGRDLNENTLKNIAYNKVIGQGEAKVIGCMVCFWCDQPYIDYDQTEVKNMFSQAEIFSQSNSDYFK